MGSNKNRGVLQALSFGKVDSESENDLAARFLKTREFEKFVDPDTLLVLGPKGSGKSAIFRFLTTFEADARRETGSVLNNIIIAPATGQGDLKEVSSADLEDIGRAPEFDYDKFWRLYISLKVASALGRNGFQSTGTLREVLRAFGQKKDYRILPMLKAGWGWAIGAPPRKVTLSVGDYAVSFEGGARIDITGLLAEEEDILQKSNKTLWLLFDRIDELQSARPDQRKALLEALFRTQISFMGRFPHIRLKIFLRTDIWSTLNFNNKSHLDDKRVELVWNADNLLRLMNKRALSTPAVRQHVVSSGVSLGSGPAEELPLSIQREIFYSIFEKQVYSGPKEADLFEWMLARITDGLNAKYPRELITFGNQSKEKQLAKDTLPDNVLISGTAVLEAFGEVSRRRVNTYLSEFAELQEHIKKFNGYGKATFTRDELTALFQGLPLSGNSAIERLYDVGVIIPKGGNVNTAREFEIPRLYRNGLGLVIPGRP